MMNRRIYYARLIFCVHLAFALGLFAVVFAVVKGKLSPIGLRTMMFLLVASFAALYVILIRKLRALPQMPEPPGGGPVSKSMWTKIQIWNLRVLLVLLVSSLLFGNWVERDGPWLPRLVGTIANLGMTWLCVKTLRLLQEKGK